MQTLKVGLAGLGFMGSTHLSAYSKITGAEVKAVYSQNPARLSGDFSNVSGNLSVRPARYDFSAVRKYREWSELVQDSELDAIDVCLPTDLHLPVALAAFVAGKHVLCEKPMGLNAADCDRMLVAARQQKDRILMIGHVLRFWPEYEYLAEFVRSANHGRVRSATFIRRSGMPEWSPWLSDLSRSGGAVLDLLLHDIDQALALFGTPQRVAAKSIGGPDAIMATLIYPGGPEVRIQGGWFAPGTPFSMSFQARAERAEIDWTPGGLMLSDATGQRRRVELPPSDAYESELSYFADCCRSGSQPDRCPPEASALAVTVALAIRESQFSDGAQITL